VFDLDGNFVSNITGSTLDDPFSIAVAADGSIWVADAGTDEVSHFSASGSLLGTADATFDQPFAVEVDQDTGLVYASEHSVGNEGVYVFNPDGSFMRKFGERLLMGGAGGLASAGLTGDLYVVHPAGNRVLRFRF
jgi:DNA-binding beta-propeller fold protein YncE